MGHPLRNVNDSKRVDFRIPFILLSAIQKPAFETCNLSFESISLSSYVGLLATLAMQKK